MVGAAQQGHGERKMSSLDGDAVDPDDLQAQIATITAFVDAWRAFEVKCLITSYDGHPGAAAERRRPDRPRLRDTGCISRLQLAEETGMRYLRRGAASGSGPATHDNDAERAAGRTSATAHRCRPRSQGAPGLRTTRSRQRISKLRGEPARAGAR